MNIKSVISPLHDSCKIMIPAIKGFIVYFCRISEQNYKKKRLHKIDIVTVLFGSLSLWLWPGVMLFIIRSSLGTPQYLLLFIGPFDSNTNFYLGRL